MWCAYAFVALALVSLPDAIQSWDVVTLVSWISQTFLQLVLLSIIIVGQNVLAAASDKRAQATYEDADAVLHTSLDIQHHLQGPRRGDRTDPDRGPPTPECLTPDNRTRPHGSSGRVRQ